jgi:hypothetical protein
MEKRYERKSGSSHNPKPESVGSKQVDCNNLKPVLKSFDKLLAFKNSSSQDCLGK